MTAYTHTVIAAARQRGPAGAHHTSVTHLHTRRHSVVASGAGRKWYSGSPCIHARHCSVGGAHATARRGDTRAPVTHTQRGGGGEAREQVARRDARRRGSHTRAFTRRGHCNSAVIHTLWERLQGHTRGGGGGVEARGRARGPH